MIKPSESSSFAPIEARPKRESGSATANQQLATASFGDAYQKAVDQEPSLKFSIHAQTRLAARNINLTPDDISHIHEAIDKAVSKGAKQSLLVVMNDQAFIVNVPSRTVITAIDRDSMKAKVFINIDSTVMV